MPTKASPQDAPQQSAELLKQEAARSDGTANAPSLDLDALLKENIIETDERPVMVPPTEVVVEEAEVGITAWHNGKKVTAMWSNSSNRNAFAALTGLGWKKISNANDSSFLAMTMMLTHAENKNATVNVKIGTDNEIHEVYVW